MGQYTNTPGYGYWCLGISPDGQTLCFTAQTNNGSQATFLTAPISWTNGAYHMVTLTYSSSNSALFIDGALVTNGLAVTVLPGTNVANSFWIGSDTNGVEQMHGALGSLATWNFPLEGSTIMGMWVLNSVFYGAGSGWHQALIVQGPSYYTNDLLGWHAVAGPGFLTDLGGISGDCGSGLLRIADVAASPGPSHTINMTFSILGTNTQPVDVFGTTCLSSPDTNAPVTWAWLGQGYTCSRYSLSLTDSAVFLVLGSALDSDMDGLTDAYERLVSHTDPNNPDSHGTGIMDGYYVAYGLTNSVDPYTQSPSGDGWSILQACQNGWNPTSYQTPPPPQALTAHYNETNGTVTLSWRPCQGAFTNYTLTRYTYRWTGGQTTVPFTLPTNATSFVDNFAPTNCDFTCWMPSYKLDANYIHGDVVSATVPAFDSTTVCPGQITRNSQGQQCFVAQSLPPDTTVLRLSRCYLYYVGGNTYEHRDTFDVPTAGLTDATAVLQDAWFPSDGRSYQWYAQTISGGGVLSEPLLIGTNPPAVAFLDGREHLKQNQDFLLRAAMTDVLFNYASVGEVGSNSWTEHTYSMDYTYAGLYRVVNPTNGADQAVLDPYMPFKENSLYRNFVIENRTDYAADGYVNDCVLFAKGDLGWEPWPFPALLYPPRFQFVSPTNYTTPLALLAPESILGTVALQESLVPIDWDAYRFNLEETGWVFSPPDNDMIPTGYMLTNSYPNLFGLPLQAVQLAHLTNNTVEWGTLTQGQSITNVGWNYVFPQFAQPSEHTVGYYFARPGIDPLPGQSVFSTTNETPPLLFAGFGQKFYLAGYAKQEIVNGYSNVFTYLGQYFDKACLIDTNGVTTNSAGTLSPYGEFLPMMPGQAALITKTNWGVNEHGACVVNVIKLQLDVNHDGNMDLSYGGPDNNSASRPFTFWVNNDCDWATHPGSPSFDPGSDKEVNPMYPDYYWDCRQPTPRSVRDLEDYARLWICGVPPLTNAGYQVTMSWANVSGNPAINVLRAVETNGGTLYLTDTNIQSLAGIPWQQIDGYVSGFGHKYPVTTTNTLTLPITWFTNAGNKYFLFEGAGIGSGQLVLTINQNGQIIAQTGTWLALHDVSDFYEQAYATNVTSGKPPSSLVSDFSVIRTAMSPAPDETKQIVVFIHGINNTVESYNQSTRTIFKRLYWSDYHGRFASFRWPCAYLPWNTANPFQYNLSEFYAFKSATALKNYLSFLRNNRPDLTGYAIDLYAHSQGNVVASEAVLQGAPFDNYILTQGAFPAHCYDTNAPFLQKLLDAETNSVSAKQTPFYPVNGGYHGYCSPIHGNLIDFYNTNDFALATGTTLGLQTNWEEDQRTQKPEAFFGGPSYIYYPSNLTTVAYYTFSSYTVTDLQEIKALVARSRSKAAGAQGGLHGAIGGSVDLFGRFGFGLTRSEHSAQFDRPIQTSKGYWDEVVRTFSPATP